MMKRLAFALALLLLLAAAAVAVAAEPTPATPNPAPPTPAAPAPPAPPEAAPPAAPSPPPEAAPPAKSSWTESITVGGYVDARPQFYWFFPNGGSGLHELHSSAVSLYEAALRVTAKPAENIVKVVATAAYRDDGRIEHVTNYYLDSDRKAHQYSQSDLGGTLGKYLFFDEGYVQVGEDFFLRVGKYYLPITVHDPKETFSMHYNLLERNLITNSLAVGVGYNYKYLAVSGHAFNGENAIADAAGHVKNDVLVIDTFAAALNLYPLAMFEHKYSLNLGGYWLSDATQTQGNFAKLFNGSDINYEHHIPLGGGYVTGKFFFTDTDASWLGLGFRAEYATTGKFDRQDYVIIDEITHKQSRTTITFMDAEVALLFFEGMATLGGTYETVNGMNYFGMLDPDLVAKLGPDAHNTGNLKHYAPSAYARYGGFLRTNLMDQLSVGLELLQGADNVHNADRELQCQARVDF
jgi:hypothetical protein